MVMVSPLVNPTACWEFEGEILVLHHPTTISTRYQAMVHCGSLRQTAQIISMSQDCLRTGDKAQVHFRFIKHPEFIKPGLRLVFREGRTKAVGNVVRAIPHAMPLQASGRGKSTKAQRFAQQVIEHNHFHFKMKIFGFIPNFLCFCFKGESQDNGDRPENQPQKPSKRNRGRRGYNPSLSTAIVTATVPSTVPTTPKAENPTS